MSLTMRERQQTAQELVAHAQALGMGEQEIADAAGLSQAQVAAVLGMGAAGPVDVWAVRDVLDAEATRRGVDAGGWSVLTDGARVQAQRWFALRDVG